MTTKLNCEGYEKYLVGTRGCYDGIQYVFRFDNGYGASIIKHLFSYGYGDDLWELAVLKFDGDETSHICYDTELTDDVIGCLSDEEVCSYLEKIKEL